MKSDENLRKDVMDEIKWNPETEDAADAINVYAGNESITLSGKVNSYRTKKALEIVASKVRSRAAKKEAESIAWSAPGVLSVDNRIDIDVTTLTEGY